MREPHYLVMRPGDLDGMPYARFWQRDMQPLQLHVALALLHGEEASALGLQMDEADRLLEPGDLDTDQIHTTGVYAQRILQGRDYRKPIEQHTTRPRGA